MNILMIGDVTGQLGRKAVGKWLPLLKTKYSLDLIIGNGENVAGGTGITVDTYQELLSYGVDVVTTGNHVWDKKEVFSFIDNEPMIVRPANYPPDTPGKGYVIVDTVKGKVGVLNLAGRVFMPALDCPFRIAAQSIEQIRHQTDIILVDFHAETTSEKMALGWYLDGKVSVVAGTHTHVQTADERILTEGTAYISDLGMCGPWNSVLGVEKDIVVRKFITALPTRFSLAKGPIVFSALMVRVDENTGRALEVKRILEVDNTIQ